MKAQIYISGQLQGNFTLRNHIQCFDRAKEGSFNSYTYNFKSVKEAKKAIRKAYWSIREQLDPDNYSVIYKSKDNTYLSYDASKAKVFKQVNGDYIEC